MKTRKTYSFDDYLLVPQYSEINSRSEVNLSSRLDCNMSLSLPIISSPMDTVTETRMVQSMNDAGGLGIIHRYNSIDKQCAMIKESGVSNAAVAVGVSGDFLERALAAVDAGAKVICIDVAHGHHVKVRHAICQLRKVLDDSCHIMAGNVATLKAFEDLADWGANSIRVGIGGGSICSTRVMTGHGVPTIQSVLDCAASDRDVAIIADGGIRNSGDIVKALAAGADFVMLGSLLAGTAESPGNFSDVNGNKVKTYRGMASKDAKIDWRGHTSSLEGVTSFVPYKGFVSDVLSELEGGIRSGLSYSGSRSIRELQSKAEFIIQTHAASIESSTHIKLLQ